jgi:serine/threonine protein kinase
MGLSAGIKVGSYEVLHLLGKGGMGEVYRARDFKLGRDAALKVLLGTPPADTFTGSAGAKFKRSFPACKL